VNEAKEAANDHNSGVKEGAKLLESEQAVEQAIFERLEQAI